MILRIIKMTVGGLNFLFLLSKLAVLLERTFKQDPARNSFFLRFKMHLFENVWHQKYIHLMPECSKS